MQKGNILSTGSGEGVNRPNVQLVNNNRDESVDFFKGMLMLGVIWGHTINSLSLDYFETGVWIHRFFRVYDMPFFMILSGFYLKQSADKYPLKTLLLNRSSMVLLPIVLWNLAKGSFNMMSFYFLWAVFLSSIICGIGHWIGYKTYKILEIFLYVSFFILFHIFPFPWNMFYLFPFFCVGYYMQNTKFQLSTPLFIVILGLLSIGMCLWRASYTPWEYGSEVWKIDTNALYIYGYRFLLSIVATYIMANVFKMLYSYIPRNITELVLKSGRETLALYILQLFVIEVLLRKIMICLNTTWYNLYPDIIQNMIGYVLAPCISVLAMQFLTIAIYNIKKISQLRWIFGIKII